MKIVTTLSGGADSVLAAIKAKERWPDALHHAVFVNYGQICKDQEYQKSLQATMKIRMTIIIEVQEKTFQLSVKL